MTEVDVALDRLSMLTDMMRQHEQAIADLSSHRADLILSLREVDRPVPYRTLADAMGVSEQAVFSTLQKHHGRRRDDD